MNRTTDFFHPARSSQFLSATFENTVAELTRERRWRRALLRQINPQPRETIADVGCGTGKLAVMLKLMGPTTSVYGFDPNPVALDRAEQQSFKAGTMVHFVHATIDDIAEKLTIRQPSQVVSSLVFHNLPIAEKQQLLEAMFLALPRGGKLHIADFGWQRTRAMQIGYSFVQALDGHANTQPNADGCLPVLMQQAGFSRSRETAVIPTITGSISLYFGVKS